VSNSPDAITNDVFSSHQVAAVPAVADANSGKQFAKHTNEALNINLSAEATA
jgi:hypothetical protein